MINKNLAQELLNRGTIVQNKKWQGVSDIPNMVELFNTTFEHQIAKDMEQAQKVCDPDLPWAEDHFLERVSGIPSNPGNTYHYWPYYKDDEKYRDQEEKFTHTYQERFWPKRANKETAEEQMELNKGIRFELGDLSDVVQQLIDNPLTRQAYLPVFFPEDTGAIHGGRIPCTLGYLFWIREGRLSCNYYIRSCDLVRHFKNDVYLAMRLTQFIGSHVGGQYAMGNLYMYIGSLHAFETDLYHLKKLTK